MKLISVRPLQARAATEAVYEAFHATPGRDGTTFKFKVVATISEDGSVQINVDLGTAEKASFTEAVAQMSGWLERAGQALKVEPKTLVPLF